MVRGAALLGLLTLLSAASARATDPVPTTDKPLTHATAPDVQARPIVPAPKADAGEPPAAPAASTAPVTRPADHKFRTEAQCHLLPAQELAQCLGCVGRPGTPKHLYRPDYPAGNRCRLDNGMP